jgi:hypothetical protein
MLYIGADIDVSILHYLRPWERWAIFVDKLGRSSLTGSILAYEQNDFPYPWNETTRYVRPWNNSMQRTSILSGLLYRRLVASGFRRVAIAPAGHATLRLDFVSGDGILRSLVYLAENIQATLGHGRVHRRVSTIAHVGVNMPSGALATILGRVVPNCLDNIRLLTTQGSDHGSRDGSLHVHSGEAEFQTEFARTGFAMRCRTQLRDYPVKYTLSGRDVYALFAARYHATAAATAPATAGGPRGALAAVATNCTRHR